MSLLKKLFGGAGPKLPDPVTYKDFLIFPESLAEDKYFRLGARIEKEINGELKTHMLIRADTFGTVEAANDAAIHKAKRLIDQMGEALF